MFSSKGRYSLSTRTLLELLPYLKDTYPEELLECTICMEVSSLVGLHRQPLSLITRRPVQIITRGIACATPNCKTRMHSHCFVNYRKGHSGCATCKASWVGAEIRAGKGKDKGKGIIPVGEDAFVEGQDQRQRMRRKESEEADEEEEEEQRADSEEPSQTRTQEASQPTRTRSKNNAQMDIDENEDEAPQPRRKSRR